MNNKRIVLSLLIGTVALCSLSFSISLAWYNASTFLHIDQIEISIDGERDLKISTTTDVDSFRESLDYDDLEKVDVFEPVSTVYSSSWLSQKAEKPVFYDNSYPFIDDEGIPNRRVNENGYYSQELYLYSDDDVYVTVDALETYIEPNLDFNRAYAQQIKSDHPDKTVEEIYECLNELSKAMRFSILVPDTDCYNFYIIDPNKEEEVSLGGILDNTGDEIFDYYESGNELYEVIYGEYNDRDLICYDDALSEDIPYSGEANAFNAKHTEGVHPFNLEKSKEQGFSFAKEQSIGLPELAEHESLLYIPVYRYTPRKIVLSIYIEGWDLASVNSTMGSSFLAGLTFKIGREM